MSCNFSHFGTRTHTYGQIHSKAILLGLLGMLGCVGVKLDWVDRRGRQIGRCTRRRTVEHRHTGRHNDRQMILYSPVVSLVFLSHLMLSYFILFSLFFHTFLLSSFWTSRGHRCRPSFPPGSCLKVYRAWGSAIPLLVDFSWSVANSRFRAFRKSICAQEKVPTNFYEYALGGIRTHETDLYQA